MLTHGHMKSVAFQISQIPDESERHATARHFEKVFKENPRFDRYRFHQAAAGHPEVGRDHPGTGRRLRSGFTRRHHQASAAALKASPETRAKVAHHVTRIHGSMDPSFAVQRFNAAAGITEACHKRQSPEETRKQERHDRKMWRDRAKRVETYMLSADELITSVLEGRNPEDVVAERLDADGRDRELEDRTAWKAGLKAHMDRAATAGRKASADIAMAGHAARRRLKAKSDEINTRLYGKADPS